MSRSIAVFGIVKEFCKPFRIVHGPQQINFPVPEHGEQSGQLLIQRPLRCNKFIFPIGIARNLLQVLIRISAVSPIFTDLRKSLLDRIPYPHNPGAVLRSSGCKGKQEQAEQDRKQYSYPAAPSSATHVFSPCTSNVILISNHKSELPDRQTFPVFSLRLSRKTGKIRKQAALTGPPD